MPHLKKVVRLPSPRGLVRQKALKWRQRPERRLRQPREVGEFLHDVGLCLARPVRGLPLPSWSEALDGRKQSPRAPTRARAHDPRVVVLQEELDNLIRQRTVFESDCLWRTRVLVARELFPSLYAITGDFDPEEDYLEQQRRGELNAFAVAVYETILREGPVVRADLQRSLGLANSRELDALAKALNQLLRTIKIVRASFTPEHGPAWDAFFRWAPEVVREARAMTRLEAAMRILGAFVNGSIVVARATTQKLFGGFLTPEVSKRAIDLLVESGQLMEWRGRLAGSACLSR